MEGYKEKEKEIMVIGHKNPDTDSICSAICYADLKNKITGTDNYVPKRAGHLNEETHFVLNRFGVEAPEYIKDVRPQVMNIEIRHTEGIDSEISVRNAWKLMDSLNVVTLPITEYRGDPSIEAGDSVFIENDFQKSKVFILKHLITEYCQMPRQVLLILLKHLGEE